MTDLKQLGIEDVNGTGSAGEMESISPGDGRMIGRVRMQTRAEYDAVVNTAQRAFVDWRMVPAPKRGDVVREIGDELRKHKYALGALVDARDGQDSGRG